MLNYFLTLTGPDARGCGQRRGVRRASRPRSCAAISRARRRDGDPAGDRGHRQHRLHRRQCRRRPRRPGGQAQRGRRNPEVGLRAAARRAVLGGPRRDPQRDHLPARRGGAARRPGRPGRRGGLVQRPGADRPDVHQGRGRVHRGGQPLQVQERRRPPRRPADNADTGDGQGAVQRRPGPAGGLPRGVRRRAGRAGRRPGHPAAGRPQRVHPRGPDRAAARGGLRRPRRASSTRAGTATSSTTSRGRSTTP